MKISQELFSADLSAIGPDAQVFDINAYLNPVSTIEDALAQFLWSQYLTTFSSPLTLLKARISAMGRSATAFFMRHPNDGIRRQFNVLSGRTKIGRDAPITALKNLVAKTPRDHIARALASAYLLTIPGEALNAVADETPALRILPDGSLTFLPNFVIKKDLVRKGLEKCPQVSTGLMTLLVRIAAQLRIETPASVFDDLLYFCKASALPLNPNALTGRVPWPNLLVLTEHAGDAYSAFSDRDDPSSYFVRSFTTFGVTPDPEPLFWNELQNLNSWIYNNSGTTVRCDDNVAWLNAMNYLRPTFYPSGLDGDVKASLSYLGAVESLGSEVSSMSAMGGSLSGSDDTDDDDSDTPKSKKKKSDDDDLGDFIDTGDSDDASANDGQGGDNNDADTGSDVSPADQEPGGGSLDGSPGNLSSNNSIDQDDPSSDSNDIDLLGKGGQDQKSVNTRTALYRASVAALCDTIERRQDLPISRDVRTELSDWCRLLLYIVDVHQTKKFLAELGLDKVLEPISL